jgi:hypothetical protein
MSRESAISRRRAVLGGLLCAAFVGCSPSTLWFLFKGDEKLPPEVPLAPKSGKREVAVLVMVSPSPSLGMTFAGADREIAALVGRRMAEETKKDDHPITVIDPARLDKLKNTPGTDWRTLTPAAIGAKLGADYVIDVSLTSMAMLPAEYGGEYYKGSASYEVVVYDTAAPDATPRQYAKTTTTPLKGKEAVTERMYRGMLTERVAAEIAYAHIPHTSDALSAPVR